MGLQETELDQVARRLEQGAQIAEPEAAVLERSMGDALQFADRMFLGQIKQALQRADRFGPPMLEHGLGPRSAGGSEEPTAAEQILGAAFDHGPLVGMDMFRVSGEAPGLGPGMDGDLLHLRVEHPNQSRLGADPQLAADVLGRHRVICPGELHIAVAVDAAARFFEAGEQTRRQRPQGRLLDRREQLEDLLANGPVDASVGDRSLPVGEELILFTEAAKLTAPERVFLGVVDTRLDLALVTRHRRLGRRQNRPVVPAELDQLGIEIGVEPVGLKDGRLQVVDDQPGRDAAKVHEGVFQAPNERLGCLAPDHLRVALARMA